MLKKYKKLLIVILSIVLTLSLVGCKNKEIARSSDIPSDGIIKSSIFKQLIEDNDMALFNGESGKISYQWMFLGKDIEDPEDINLLIDFENEENLEEVKKQSKTDLVQFFKFEDMKNIKSKPAISIILDKKWKATSADIYKYSKDEKTLSKVSGATVQNSDKTIINFSLLDRDGEFYIVGSDPKQDAIDKDNEKIEDEKNSQDNLEQPKTQSVKEQESLDLKKELGINTDIGKPNEGGKDQYLTDPIPEGKPKPVEPQDAVIDKTKKKTCTLSVRCDTLLQPANMKVITENGKQDMVPPNGVIFDKKQVEFYEGESVFDVLYREVFEKSKIHMEYEFTPIYNSVYIEGINNLYEFDGGELSGWMYKVNGWFPNYGASRYQLKEGEVIEWVYTCDLGRDVGCEWLGNK